MSKCPLRIVICKHNGAYFWRIQGYNGKAILISTKSTKIKNTLMRTIKNFTDKMSNKRVEIVNQ